MIANKIKVGDSVTRVEVCIDEFMNVSKITNEKLCVIGVSKHFAVLNDELFEMLSLSKTFKFCHTKPEGVVITESKSSFDIKYFGKFRIKICSRMTDKRIENKINKEFKLWLDNKVGCYGSAKEINIDLSIANKKDK